jgi:GTP cyclohydrolase I
VAKALLFALRGNAMSAAGALGTALFTERALSAPPPAALDAPADGAALSGSEDSEDVFEVATGAAGGLVVVRHIELFSTSETDLQPFFGRCHVGYLPAAGRIVGLSKTARIAEVFARRLQTPQRLADEIAVRLNRIALCIHPRLTHLVATGGAGGGCGAARCGCAAGDMDAGGRGGDGGGLGARAPPAAHVRRHAWVLRRRGRVVG